MNKMFFTAAAIAAVIFIGCNPSKKDSPSAQGNQQPKTA
jgi:ABC-type phosphate/phosphonate transport system substrate-binding protein